LTFVGLPSRLATDPIHALRSTLMPLESIGSLMQRAVRGGYAVE